MILFHGVQSLDVTGPLEVFAGANSWRALGRESALDIARHLVVFLRRPGNQAQFSTQLAAQLVAADRYRSANTPSRRS